MALCLEVLLRLQLVVSVLCINPRRDLRCDITKRVCRTLARDMFLDEHPLRGPGAHFVFLHKAVGATVVSPFWTFGIPSISPRGRLAQKMLFVGKVVRVLCQANTLYLSTSAAPRSAWPGDSAVGDGVGDGVGGDVGVSEAEVLELTQRWSELRDREDFHLLALERAVHEVMPCCRGHEPQ